MLLAVRHLKPVIFERQEKMIKVSIIITSYNYSRYLNRSLRSAFVQNYPHEKYEIIVVDDWSTDWSREIIESYGTLIKKIYLRKNSGLAVARNAGIKKARGKYIIFLDADDYLNREAIFIMTEFLDFNRQYAAVACDYYLIDDKERIIGRNSCKKLPIACGIMFRRNKLIKVGMYDEKFRMHEEKDLQIRFCKDCKISHISFPLYRYRQHPYSLSCDRANSSKHMKKLKDKHRA